MRIVLARQCWFILIVIFSSGTAMSAPAISMEKLTSISDTRYLLHESESLKHSYHLYVRLPQDYTPDSSSKYPTVYLLDGGITYPLLAAYSRYLDFAEDIPPLIIVGISYGTDDFREGNRRSTDFTAPAKDRAHYGGAEKFQAMLRNELFPLVEDRFPSDPNRRILFGQSIGGQFAIYSALTDPSMFMGLIASNPALHRNLDFFLNTKPVTQAQENKPLLFISRAEKDDPRFKRPAQKWLDHWRKQTDPPFKMKVDTVMGHNHFSAAPEAFRNGLKWMFAP